MKIEYQGIGANRHALVYTGRWRVGGDGQGRA